MSLSCLVVGKGFVKKDYRLLYTSFVSLLRQSSDLWISKLVSGLGMAIERHHKDESILVHSQLSSILFVILHHLLRLMGPSRRRMSMPSSIQEKPSCDPAQYTLSQIFANLDLAKHWTVSCIRPNDSELPY
jgi:chitin synthase